MDLVSEQHHSSTLSIPVINEVILCRLRVKVEHLIIEQGCENQYPMRFTCCCWESMCELDDDAVGTLIIRRVPTYGTKRKFTE
jgi:hypothetical protein